MAALTRSDPEFARHLRQVAKAILRGNVVPVLGAGANLCDRAPGEPWTPGSNLPSGSELARLLADEFDCEVPDRSDLVRVSQYADVTEGEGPLYAQLREVFVQECPIPSLHRFLAGLHGWMVDHGRQPRTQLIVTTISPSAPCGKRASSSISSATSPTGAAGGCSSTSRRMAARRSSRSPTSTTPWIPSSARSC